MKLPVLGGMIHCKQYKNWDVSWETDGDYRHWCIQRPSDSPTSRLISVVLTNPGTLSGDGRELARDTTLRILRTTFEGTRYGCLILNLFDFATPKPPVLFGQWNNRDKIKSKLVYEVFPQKHVVATIFAYGDYENSSPPTIRRQVKDRISLIRDRLRALPVIESPLNRTGSPKHVMKWQIDGHIDEMNASIREWRQ
jgi:hypothetical protein